MLLGRSQFDWDKVMEYYNELDKLLSKYKDVVAEEVIDFDHPWINMVVIKSFDYQDKVNREKADNLHNAILRIGQNFYYKLTDMHEPTISYKGEGYND